MSMTNVLPEVRMALDKNSSIKNFILTIFSSCLGVLLMYGVTLIE
jgi:hypothetical protein